MGELETNADDGSRPAVLAQGLNESRNQGQQVIEPACSALKDNDDN
jgi:hypothetical protein